jgi:hypothetical protein
MIFLKGRNFLDRGIEYILPLTRLLIPMHVLYLGFETCTGHLKLKYKFIQDVFLVYIV